MSFTLMPPNVGASPWVSTVSLPSTFVLVSSVLVITNCALADDASMSADKMDRKYFFMMFFR